MRFQTITRIPGQSPEQVLGVLEVCLRSVSKDVVREGRRITLFGLGPSPRGINRRDRTVIDVNAEDGVTTIDADVSFQASAFLGNTPQGSVVQAKLDRVFEDLRTQLGVDRWLTSAQEKTPVSAEPETLAYFEALPEAPLAEEAGLSSATDEVFEDRSSGELEPSVTSSKAETFVETVPEEVPDAKIAEIEIQPEPEPVESTAAEVYRTPKPSAEEHEENAPSTPIVRPEPIVAEPPPASQAAAEKVQPEVVTVQFPPAVKEALASEEKQPKPPPQTVGVEPRSAEYRPVSAGRPNLPTAIAIATPGAVMSKPPPQEPLRATQTFSTRSSNTLLNGLNSEDDENKSRLLKWSARVAAIIVLVVAPAAWLYLPRHLEERAPTAHVHQPPAALPQASPAQPAVETPAPKEPGSDKDPAAVVKDWELALRSRDAVAQAAFYADPVGRYFLRHDVSRDKVLADKQAAIDKRKGIWTVKMERVNLTRKGGRNAKVNLVKHYMVQENGEPVSEWFVPSQLKLVRADGKWQITSERDLGLAPSMDDLDY